MLIKLSVSAELVCKENAIDRNFTAWLDVCDKANVINELAGFRRRRRCELAVRCENKSRQLRPEVSPSSELLIKLIAEMSFVKSDIASPLHLHGPEWLNSRRSRTSGLRTL